MRILISNAHLESWGGSELYARDVARGLRERGHTPYLFSHRLGPLADDLRREGFTVVDDPARLPEAPDIIHGQHHGATMAALDAFHGVPAVFFCHGIVPWEEIPPHHPRIGRYVAISPAVAAHLAEHCGVPGTAIEVVGNFVDLRRFQPRGPLPACPQRALVFGNYASETELLPAVRAACGQSGIAVDAIGAGVGRVAREPESLLGSYDLVFALGRSALEAMAVGAAVVVCNTEGTAGPVLPGNFVMLRRANFGRAALRRPATAAELARDIAAYDPAGAIAVRERVRREASLDAALERILAIYAEALASFTGPLDPVAERDARLRYQRWLHVAIRDRLLSPLRETEVELRASRQREQESEAELRASRQREEQAEVELRASRQREQGAAGREVQLREQVSRMADSLAWRAAAAAARVPGVLPLYRALRRALPRLWQGTAGQTPRPAPLPDAIGLACVVLCHRGQPEVVDAVRSLVAQEPRCEIVVVNSEGTSPEPLLQAAGLPVAVIHREGRLLPGAARNLGVASTSAPFVSFLAADCTALPGWVRGRLERHGAGAATVSSPIVNATPGNLAALVSYLLLFPHRMPGTPPDRVQHYGLSYARTLLDGLGPFREDLRSGEDTEFNRRAAAISTPAWAPEVRTTHRHPQTLHELLRDQCRRGERSARAYARLDGGRHSRRVAANALRRLFPSLALAARALGTTAGWRIVPATLVAPAAALAYAWGALRADRDPGPSAPRVAAAAPPAAPPRQPRVYALCSFRDEARFLPGLLENLEGLVDGLLALDDGSADGSAEIVAAHPLTTRLIRLPRPPDGAWDEAGNQRRLIEAAWETDADWLIAIDADERLELGFRERARSVIERADRAGHRGYWVRIREIWDRPDTFRVDGVWGRKGHLRLFRCARDHEFDTRPLHRHWGPMNARVDGEFLPADLTIYHLRMMRAEDRAARRARYERLDPESRWQAIGYAYLTDEEGIVLERLPPGREYRPLG